MTEKKPEYKTDSESGGIVRVVKDGKYFTASNEPFNDKRISWETRGLMGYLLSKPDKWVIRMRDLMKQGPAGEFKLRRMLAEARLYGYMTRIRITQPGGTFTWITDVYESPSLNPNKGKKEIVKITSSGFPTSGSATSGKPPDVLITEEEITEGEDDEPATLAKIKSSQFGEIIKSYESNIGPITPLLAEKLGGLFDDYYSEPDGPNWLPWSFDVAVSGNGRNLNYIQTCLSNRKKYGKNWKPENGNGHKKPKTMSGTEAAKILRGEK